MRPTRNGIFQIRSDVEGKKLVTHIYGHGGAGLTLAAGSVDKGLKLFEQALTANPKFKNKPIRVVGAGIMGMWSAVGLAKKGYTVKISAKELKNLPSYYAAGIFGPAPDSMMVSKDELKLVDAVAARSYTIYAEIAAGRHPYIKRGPEPMPIYVGAHTNSGLDPLVAMGVMPTPEQVLVDFGNGKKHFSTKFASFFIHGPKLMAELHREAKALRIKIVKEHIRDLQRIPEPIIFDCSGLGARELAHDDRMVPVLGHILMLKDQPPKAERNYMVLVEANGKMLYVTPKGEGAVGSSFIKGEGRLNSHKEQYDLVLARAIDFFGGPPQRAERAANAAKLTPDS